MAMITPEILLICTGSLKDRHIAALMDGYLDRLRHEARITVREVRDSTRLREGAGIVDLLEKEGGYSFALAEEGSMMSSRRLARRMETITGKLIFIIGGPEGLDPVVKKKAGELLSLSPMTFTHEMARVLLAEQLYRACTIMHNRRYHRD